MKRKQLLNTLIIIMFFSVNIQAQKMDCLSLVKFREATKSFKIDDRSKSAVCYTGQKYEYIVFLMSNIEYRFSFYASTVFNNNIRFKIINQATGEVVLDLPGEAAGNNTSAILQDYYDRKQNKFIHPYFDITPEADADYQIIVEVGELKADNGLNSNIMLADADLKKGCVSIFLQSKEGETYGF